MAVKIATVKASTTGVFHDGRNMIVLSEGKKATVSESSLAFLRKRKLIADGTDKPQLDHDGNGEAGGDLPDDPPALTGKNKAELLAIAEAEGVEVEDGATNEQIREAIEAAREGGDEAPPA